MSKDTGNFQLKKDEVRTPQMEMKLTGGCIIAGYQTMRGPAASGGPQAIG